MSSDGLRIKDLPGSLKLWAMNNQKFSGNEINTNIHFWFSSENGGFTWSNTPEGSRFWSELQNDILVIKSE